MEIGENGFGNVFALAARLFFPENLRQGLRGLRFPRRKASLRTLYLEKL